MSVTSFLHLSETGGGEFDIETFRDAIANKYPGTDTEQSHSGSSAYDITWSLYSDRIQFELKLDRTRRTLAVEYFNAEDRIRDYAKLILWLRMYFPKEKEVILVDENNEAQISLSQEAVRAEIEAWLVSVGI